MKCLFCCAAWATNDILKKPTSLGDDVKILLKGLQEPTQPTEWEDGEV